MSKQILTKERAQVMAALITAVATLAAVSMAERGGKGGSSARLWFRVAQVSRKGAYRLGRLAINAEKRYFDLVEKG